MSCPHCGDTRTEVLKTVYRGRSMYRVRRCSFCKGRFSTQERPVSWNHLDRKWPGRSPSRKGWRKNRGSALRGTCEVLSSGMRITKESPKKKPLDGLMRPCSACSLNPKKTSWTRTGTAFEGGCTLSTSLRRARCCGRCGMRSSHVCC